MLTETAKLFLPMSAVGFVMAIAYGNVTDDRTGMTIVLVLMTAAAFCAAFLAAVRDRTAVGAPAAPSGPPETRELVPGPTPAVGAWPLIAALGAALTLAGFVVGSGVAVAGLMVTSVGLVGWVALVSGEARGRVVNLAPLSIPVTAMFAIGALIFFMSRILLAVPAHASTAIAISMATLILAVCAFVAWRPEIRPPLTAGLLVVAGVVLLAGGLTAAAVGQRSEEKPADVGLPPVQVTAKSTKFSRAEITLTADQPATITFRNDDAQTFHNIAIYADKAYSQGVFVGTPIEGVTSIEYHLHAPSAGTYYFRCDFHPTVMEGTVTVEPG